MTASRAAHATSRRWVEARRSNVYTRRRSHLRASLLFLVALLPACSLFSSRPDWGPLAVEQFTIARAAHQATVDGILKIFDSPDVVQGLHPTARQIMEDEMKKDLAVSDRAFLSFVKLVQVAEGFDVQEIIDTVMRAFSGSKKDETESGK